MDNDIVPQGDAPERPSLQILPEGLETYHALRRNRQFVTLHYRKPKAARLDTIAAWIGAVLDDIAQADFIVTEDIQPILIPNGPASPTGQTAFTASLKLAIRPRVEIEEESAAWVEALRAHLARKKE